MNYGEGAEEKDRDEGEGREPREEAYMLNFFFKSKIFVLVATNASRAQKNHYLKH
jgi:hypothetical protein